MMKARFGMVVSLAVLSIGGSLWTAHPANAAATVTILDTLGVASPGTTFDLFGSAGQSIFGGQVVGPQFTLTAPTLITEIGGFVNNCKGVVGGVPLCPGTLPFTVQIRRSTNGLPEASAALATFVLSHDNQPLVYSYESVAPDIALGAGTYFALFAPQNGDEGSLLSAADNPFSYLAGLTTLGFLDPTTGTSVSSLAYGATRIRGILLPTSKDECKGTGWQNFGIFKNQGDCVSSIATGRTSPPG